MKTLMNIESANANNYYERWIIGCSSVVNWCDKELTELLSINRIIQKAKLFSIRLT